VGICESHCSTAAQGAPQHIKHTHTVREHCNSLGSRCELRLVLAAYLGRSVLGRSIHNGSCTPSFWLASSARGRDHSQRSFLKPQSFLSYPLDYGLRTTDYGLRTTDYSLIAFWQAKASAKMLQGPTLRLGFPFLNCTLQFTAGEKHDLSYRACDAHFVFDLHPFGEPMAAKHEREQAQASRGLAPTRTPPPPVLLPNPPLTHTHTHTHERRLCTKMFAERGD
jgi:hypothetical protein